MSVTSASPAFADPLAEDALTPPTFTQGGQSAVPGERVHQGTIIRDRATLLAPDTNGRSGADAIELVRSSGLIAAIETIELADASHHGRVVDQDPPAGTPMLREGVLTLRVAQAPAELQNTDDDPATLSYSESSAEADDAAEDDTEQWFATLGPTLELPLLGADVTAPRRRRKPRPAPGPRLAPETPPDPHPGLFASLVVALLVRLPRRPHAGTWARRALILAGAILGVFLLTRVDYSHSHTHAAVSLAQARASHTAAVAVPVSAAVHTRKRRAAPRRSRRHTSRQSSAPVRLPTPRNSPREPIASAAGAADPDPTSPPASPSPVSTGERTAPFIYLGN